MKHKHLCLVCGEQTGWGDEGCEYADKDHDFDICDTCRKDPFVRKEYNLKDSML